MNLELIHRLFSYPARGNGKDLSVMQKIDAWQNHLHRRFETIHVAGTNGKGSVTTKIASALQKSGCKVGLYTSPHISTFRERIQVDGHIIPPDFVEEFLPRLFAFIEKENLQPTFFELLTALAFECFAAEQIDVAVLEVGLGGALDATNVVTPILSVITSIAYDHMEILGLTLDEIAATKAGIIKPGVPVVVGPHASLSPILNAAGKNLILAPQADGYYDHENSAIARTALEYLRVPEEAICDGLKARPPCRFQIIDMGPVILDVAHNPDGFSHLAQALEIYYPGMKFHFALAMGRGKDPVRCVEKIQSQAFKISCLSNSHPRLLSVTDLLSSLQLNGFENVYPAVSIDEVLSQNDPTVICGSFFIMNDARRALKIDVPADPCAFTPIRSSREMAQLPD